MDATRECATRKRCLEIRIVAFGENPGKYRGGVRGNRKSSEGKRARNDSQRVEISNNSKISHIALSKGDALPTSLVYRCVESPKPEFFADFRFVQKVAPSGRRFRSLEEAWLISSKPSPRSKDCGITNGCVPRDNLRILGCCCRCR